MASTIWLAKLFREEIENKQFLPKLLIIYYRIYIIYIYNTLNNKISSVMGSGIMLTSNEMRYIIKVINSLEKRNFKERNCSEERGLFSNFLDP